MKKTIVFCLCIFSLLFLSSGENLQAQTWNTIRSGDYHYEIMFPTLPQEVFKNVSEGLKITTYAQSGQGTYFTKILVFNSTPKNPTATAKKTLTSLATKMGGKIIEEEAWTNGESIGTLGVIDIPKAGEDKPQMKIQCNVIVVGKIQYQIMVMAPTEAYDDWVADRFVGSFRFL